MYLSQTSITLVLLLFLTSTVFYQTIELKTDNVESSIEAKKVSMETKNIESTVDNNIDKIVNDVFVNISYEIMNGDRDFFDNASEAEKSIEDNITAKLNNSINNSNIILYNFNIFPTDNPTEIHITGDVIINYGKTINNVNIIIFKNINIDKRIKLKTIPDPYVYRNTFYYKWNNYRNVDLNGLLPTDGTHRVVCIILNNTNFNYNEMNNASNYNEIRIIGKNESGADSDYVPLPFWVQMWKEGPTNRSIIWVNCSDDNLIGGDNIRIAFNSTCKNNGENPDKTFVLFDDFNENALNTTKWNNISGNYSINNGYLTVYGNNSCIYSKNNYSEGYTLVFKGIFKNHTNVSIGFFEYISYNNGVGWNLIPNGNIYTRNNFNNMDVVGINQNNYINIFRIYALKRVVNDLEFNIFNNDLTTMYCDITYNNANNINYPITINMLENNSNNTIIDWTFLAPGTIVLPNDISTNTQYSPEFYKEVIPKTYVKTIYYGDETQYNRDPIPSNYSIIGILTNATDNSWGGPGYIPKELN